MKTVLVGAGGIARQHLSCLATLPRVEVAAVCDLSEVTARATADRFGLPCWSTDYAAVLRDVRPDVVHVTTPVASHLTLAVMALEHGAHVIVEKPATSTQHELDKLLETADRVGRRVIENYNYVFNRPVQDTLRSVEDGSFGDVVHVEVEVCLDVLGPDSAYLDPSSPAPVVHLPGGAIADFLPHLVSVAHEFVGARQTVHATWRRRRADIDLPADEFRGLVEAEAGSASLVFSAHSQPDAFFVRVYGTKARAQMNLFESRLTIDRTRSFARPLVPVVNGAVESLAVAKASLGGLMGKLSGGPAAYDGLWELIKRSYAALEKGDPPPISARTIREVNGWVDDLTEGAPR